MPLRNYSLTHPYEHTSMPPPQAKFHGGAEVCHGGRNIWDTRDLTGPAALRPLGAPALLRCYASLQWPLPDKYALATDERPNLHNWHNLHIWHKQIERQLQSLTTILIY